MNTRKAAYVVVVAITAYVGFASAGPILDLMRSAGSSTPKPPANAASGSSASSPFTLTIAGPDGELREIPLLSIVPQMFPVVCDGRGGTIDNKGECVPSPEYIRRLMSLPSPIPF